MLMTSINVFAAAPQMGGSDLIALAASVGACASAVVSVFILIEMGRQRATSYLPQLYPSSLLFTAATDAGLLIPTQWTMSGLSDIDASSAQAFVPLYNIGQGPAKNVKLAWSFDLRSAVLRANDLIERAALLPAYFWIADDLLEFRSRAVGFTMGTDQSQPLDFVLPISVRNSPYSARIPQTFFLLASVLINAASRLDEEPFMDFPKLKLEISFEDISGVRHAAHYALSLRIVHHALSPDGSQEYMASIDVKRD